MLLYFIFTCRCCRQSFVTFELCHPPWPFFFLLKLACVIWFAVMLVMLILLKIMRHFLLDLRHHQLQYLPPPWGDCKSTQMDSEFFSTYSISACRIDCETRYLLENCNCRMVHMPGRSSVDKGLKQQMLWKENENNVAYWLSTGLHICFFLCHVKQEPPQFAHLSSTKTAPTLL